MFLISSKHSNQIDIGKDFGSIIAKLSVLSLGPTDIRHAINAIQISQLYEQTKSLMTSGCAFLHTKTVNTLFMWQIIITHYVSIVNGPNFDSFITQSLVVCRLASPTIRRVTCSTVRQLNLQFSIHCTLFVTHSSPKLRNCNIKSHK